MTKHKSEILPMVSVPKPHTNMAMRLPGELLFTFNYHLKSIFPSITM